MTDLTIKDPFKINMEVVETEDYLPSFKVFVKIETNHVIYTNKIWFECSKWDNFLLGLSKIEKQSSETVLIDMSEKLIISIQSQIDNFKIIVISKEAIIDKNTFLLHYEAELDKSLFRNIKEAFNGFPKWW